MQRLILSKGYIAAIALVGAGMYMLGQAQVKAGTVSGQYVTADAYYDFTDCEQPVLYADQIYDGETYLAAIDRYNATVEQVNVYQTCIRREAERDIETQTTLIREAYERESDQVQTRLGEMRAIINAWAQR